MNETYRVYRVAEYQLMYFPVRGRVNAIRYLLQDNGIKYEDVNMAADPAKWLPVFKPQMPFGQAPLLRTKDFELAQSCAILRYLGKAHGLYPSDIKEQAKLDMINDQITDVKKDFIDMVYKEYETVKDKYIEGIADKLKPFETLMTKWGNDFITKDISFADYYLLDLLECQLAVAPKCLDTLPWLKNFVSRMQARAGLKAYQSTEAFKKIPFTGSGKL